jgi:hypothetical protein
MAFSGEFLCKEDRGAWQADQGLKPCALIEWPAVTQPPANRSSGIAISSGWRTSHMLMIISASTKSPTDRGRAPSNRHMNLERSRSAAASNADSCLNSSATEAKIA